MEAIFSLTYTSRDLNTCKPGDHLAYMYLDAVGASKTRSHEYPTKNYMTTNFVNPNLSISTLHTYSGTLNVHIVEAKGGSVQIYKGSNKLLKCSNVWSGKSKIWKQLVSSGWEKAEYLVKATSIHLLQLETGTAALRQSFLGYNTCFNCWSASWLRFDVWDCIDGLELSGR